MPKESANYFGQLLQPFERLSQHLAHIVLITWELLGDAFLDVLPYLSSGLSCGE